MLAVLGSSREAKSRTSRPHGRRGMRPLRRNNPTRQNANMENQKIVAGAFQQADGSWRIEYADGYGPVEHSEDPTNCNCDFPVILAETPYYCHGCCRKVGRVVPCPRCGCCGFIEDADMNLAGECPQCNGTGRALESQREAAGTADEKPDGQAENAKTEGPAA